MAPNVNRPRAGGLPVSMTRKVWAVLGIAAVLVAAAVLLLPRLRTPSLRASLAEALNVPERDFFVNIPPAPSRYPGSVFATAQWLPLERVEANDPGLERRPAPFTLRLARFDDARAEGGVSSGLFGEVLRNRRVLDIDVSVDSAVVLEASVPELKRRLLDSEAVRSALDKGARPVVVTRAYEGRVTLTLRRRRDTSGEGWAAVTRAACSATGDCPAGVGGLVGSDTTRLSTAASATDTLAITIPQPVVFAYQVMEASFVTTHLGASGPDSVVLRPVRDTAAPPADSRAAGGTAAAPGSDWALLTVAMGHYPKLQTRSQPWNAVSAALVRDALAPYGPRWVDSLAGTPDQPLTDAAVVAAAADAARRAKAAGARAVIVYYIGHAFALPGDDVTLLMGDAAAGPAASTPRPPTTLSESSAQVDALSQLADQLSARLQERPPGLLALERLYSALDSVGLPFALLVDGCLESDEVAEFRERLGFVLGPGNTNQLLYTGSAELITGELGAYAGMLRDFADDLPYLHASNPVVLAAKPGTLAVATRDPRWAWGDPVGPLAARIARFVDASRLDAEPPTLAEVVRQSAEYRGLGEIRPRGSISWSEFGPWQASAGAIRPAGVDAVAPAGPRASQDGKPTGSLRAQ